MTALRAEGCGIALTGDEYKASVTDLLSVSYDMLPTVQGGGAKHQRGNAFPSPAGRLYGFPRAKPGCMVLAAKGVIKNGALGGAHLASAAVLYTFRGREPSTRL